MSVLIFRHIKIKLLIYNPVKNLLPYDKFLFTRIFYLSFINISVSRTNKYKFN